MNLSVDISQLREYPKAGWMHSIKCFKSEYVNTRRVDIWLPEHYNPDTKHSVVYMHDGQNLFDSELSFDGQTWAADTTLQRLINESKVVPTIIVAIWNTKLRYQEYFPLAAWEGLAANQRKKIKFNNTAKPLSDDYLHFIVKELKPFVDANYAVHTKAESTFIAGSSMGALISAYALASYPEVFGGAACISTHWPLGEELDNLAFSAPFIDWLAKKLPPLRTHRLYFDFGTDGFDSTYSLHQEVLDKKLEQKGYAFGSNWITYKAEGAKHHESYWRERLAIPMQFLLKR